MSTILIHYIRRSALLLAVLGWIDCGNLLAEKIYWTNSGRGGSDGVIWRSDLDGGHLEEIITNIERPRGIALNVAGGQMFWYGGGGPRLRNSLFRSDLDGANVETLVTALDPLVSRPEGIALDVSAGKIYWADLDGASITRANLDGSGVEVVWSRTSSIRDLALDTAAGKVYWGNRAQFDDIHRANLDGTDVEVLIDEGIGNPRGLALDLRRGKMYWVDGESTQDRVVMRANLDGTGIETVLDIDGPLFLQDLELDVNDQKIYGVTNASVFRADLDGTNFEEVFNSSSCCEGRSFSFEGIALDLVTPDDVILTLAQSQLARMRPLSEVPETDGTAAIFSSRPAGDGVEYNVSLEGTRDDDPPVAEVWIGAAADELGLRDLTAFDVIEVTFANTDNSHWSAALYVRTSDDSLYQGEFQLLPVGASPLVRLELPGVASQISTPGQVIGAPSQITEVGFVVRGVLDGQHPNPSNPDVANFQVLPVPGAIIVPEPSTVALAALGLIFRASLRRRRQPHFPPRTAQSRNRH